MDALPNSIVMLDRNMKSVRRLIRTHFEHLHETDYDKLIVDQRLALTDVLMNADLLEEGSTLRLLGTQVDGIDVLFAEQDELGNFSRLVIVEDKLLSNHEQRRKVLAQVLEYARHLQDMSDSDLIGHMRVLPSERTWLEEHRVELAICLRRGDFLLVICGDRIDSRLVNLAEPFINRHCDPLDLYRLSLVAFPLYVDGDTVILVPNVVGKIVRGERDLTITVVVQDSSRKTVDATVSVERAETAPAVVRSKGAWSEERFFEQAGKTATREGVAGLRRIYELRELPELSARVDWGSGAQWGTFLFRLGNTTIFNPFSNGSVSFNFRELMQILGANVATRIAKDLADLLGAPLNLDRPYPTFYTEALANDAIFDRFKKWVNGLGALLSAKAEGGIIT